MSIRTSEIVRVVFDYKGIEVKNSLALLVDEVVQITGRTEDGWCFGVTGGSWGWFPNSYTVRMGIIEKQYEWKLNEICKILESKEWSVYWIGECKLKVCKKDKRTHLPVTIDSSNFSISLKTKLNIYGQNEEVQCLRSGGVKPVLVPDSTAIHQENIILHSNKYCEIEPRIAQMKQNLESKSLVLDYTLPQINFRETKKIKTTIKGADLKECSNNIRASDRRQSVFTTLPLLSSHQDIDQDNNGKSFTNNIKNFRNILMKSTKNIKDKDKIKRRQNSNKLTNYSRDSTQGSPHYTELPNRAKEFQYNSWQNKYDIQRLQNSFSSYKLKLESVDRMYHYFLSVARREFEYSNSFEELVSYGLKFNNYPSVNNVVDNLVNFQTLSAQAHKDYANNIFKVVCPSIKQFQRNYLPKDIMIISELCKDDEKLEDLRNKIFPGIKGPINSKVIQQCVMNKCNTSQFCATNLESIHKLSEEVKNRQQIQLMQEYNKILKDYIPKYIQAYGKVKKFEEEYLNVLKGVFEKVNEFEQIMFKVKNEAMKNLSKSVGLIDIEADCKLSISFSERHSSSPLTLSLETNTHHESQSTEQYCKK